LVGRVKAVAADQACVQRNDGKADRSQQWGIGGAVMRYKPKNIAALHIALGGLPDKMRIEAD
jgi:hypothetical protein